MKAAHLSARLKPKLKLRWLRLFSRRLNCLMGLRLNEKAGPPQLCVHTCSCTRFLVSVAGGQLQGTLPYTTLPYPNPPKQEKRSPNCADDAASHQDPSQGPTNYSSIISTIGAPFLLPTNALRTPKRTASSLTPAPGSCAGLRSSAGISAAFTTRHS